MDIITSSLLRIIKENLCFKDGKFRRIDVEDVHRHVNCRGHHTNCTWEGDSKKLKVSGFTPENLSCSHLLLSGARMDLWHSRQ